MNEYHTTCKGCYWADKCDSEHGCKYYTSLDPDYELEYLEDLDMREKEYMKIILEMQIGE